MSFSKSAFVFFCCIVGLSTNLIAQSGSESLASAVRAIQEDGAISGLTYGIVTSTGMDQYHSLGFANPFTASAYSDNSIQISAAASKAILSLSIMKAVELGLVDLDADINSILPYTVINPHNRKTPLTLRHLATHTSGINDQPANYFRTYQFFSEADHTSQSFSKDERKYLRRAPFNSKYSLNALLKEMLTPEGAFYNRRHFDKAEPGTKYIHSNVGAALAAHVIELASGMFYDQFTREYILGPLEMSSTIWNIEGDIPSNHAVSYAGSNGVAMPVYNMITYPEGGVRTNIVDLGKLVNEIIKGIDGNGKVLSPESYKNLFSSQSTSNSFSNMPDDIRSIGLMFGLDANGSVIYSESSYGGAATISINPQNGVGRILMSNNDIRSDKKRADAYNRIWNVIGEYAPAQN
jgi:CubicO group peptidase (beta-lactamase class C family)